MDEETAAEGRALGQAAAAAPGKMGILRQKALDAGMPFKDYLLYLADRELQGQPVQANEAVAEVQEQLAALRSEIRALARQPPPAPQPDTMQQFQAFAGMVESMRKLFPQQSITDILGQLEALDKVRDRLYSGGDSTPEAMQREDAPEDMLTRFVMDGIMRSQQQQQPILSPESGTAAQPAAPDISQSLGRQQVAASTPNSAAAAVSPAAQDVHAEETPGAAEKKQLEKAAVAPAPQIKVKEAGKVLTDKEVQEWAAKVPEEARKAIREGRLSLDEAVHQVRVMMLRLGLPEVKYSEVKKVYDEVKK